MNHPILSLITISGEFHDVEYHHRIIPVKQESGIFTRLSIIGMNNLRGGSGEMP
jgi:hypothetical protein